MLADMSANTIKSSSSASSSSNAVACRKAGIDTEDLRRPLNPAPPGLGISVDFLRTPGADSRRRLPEKMPCEALRPAARPFLAEPVPAVSIGTCVDLRLDTSVFTRRLGDGGRSSAARPGGATILDGRGIRPRIALEAGVTSSRLCSRGETTGLNSKSLNLDVKVK